MNPLRLFKSSLVLAVGLGLAFAAPAFAQRVNAPGTYDASVVYIPGISVPGGLPECVEQFAQQTYVGQITVTETNQGYKAIFEGTNLDDSSLRIRATGNFSPLWAGFQLGPLGGRTDAIIGIDAATMLGGAVSGKIIGQNGKSGHLGVKVGPGGVIESCKFTGQGAK
jgi:hypothetical protein